MAAVNVVLVSAVEKILRTGDSGIIVPVQELFDSLGALGDVGTLLSVANGLHSEVGLAVSGDKKFMFLSPPDKKKVVSIINGVLEKRVSRDKNKDLMIQALFILVLILLFVIYVLCTKLTK